MPKHGRFLSYDLVGPNGFIDLGVVNTTEQKDTTWLEGAPSFPCTPNTLTFPFADFTNLCHGIHEDLVRRRFLISKYVFSAGLYEPPLSVTDKGSTLTVYGVQNLYLKNAEREPHEWSRTATCYIFGYRRNPPYRALHGFGILIQRQSMYLADVVPLHTVLEFPRVLAIEVRIPQILNMVNPPMITDVINSMDPYVTCETRMGRQWLRVENNAEKRCNNHIEYCAICLESFVFDQTTKMNDVRIPILPVCLPCGHAVCASCIVKWWKKSTQVYPTCPLCRTVCSLRPDEDARVGLYNGPNLGWDWVGLRDLIEQQRTRQMTTTALAAAAIQQATATAAVTATVTAAAVTAAATANASFRRHEKRKYADV